VGTAGYTCPGIALLVPASLSRLPSLAARLSAACHIPHSLVTPVMNLLQSSRNLHTCQFTDSSPLRRVSGLWAFCKAMHKCAHAWITGRHPKRHCSHHRLSCANLRRPWRHAASRGIPCNGWPQRPITREFQSRAQLLAKALCCTSHTV